MDVWTACFHFLASILVMETSKNVSASHLLLAERSCCTDFGFVCTKLCVTLLCQRESHFFPPLPTFLKNPKWGITLCLFVCSPRGMIKCSVLLQTSALLSVRRSSKVSTGLSTKWDSQSTTGLSVFCGASLPGVKSKLGQTLWDYISDSQLTGLTQVL